MNWWILDFVRHAISIGHGSIPLLVNRCLRPAAVAHRLSCLLPVRERSAHPSEPEAGRT
jgi:hypothetical protein